MSEINWVVMSSDIILARIGLPWALKQSQVQRCITQTIHRAWRHAAITRGQTCSTHSDWCNLLTLYSDAIKITLLAWLVGRFTGLEDEHTECKSDLRLYLTTLMSLNTWGILWKYDVMQAKLKYFGNSSSVDSGEWKIEDSTTLSMDFTVY